MASVGSLRSHGLSGSRRNPWSLSLSKQPARPHASGVVTGGSGCSGGRMPTFRPSRITGPSRVNVRVLGSAAFDQLLQRGKTCLWIPRDLHRNEVAHDTRILNELAKDGIHRGPQLEVFVVAH